MCLPHEKSAFISHTSRKMAWTGRLHAWRLCRQNPKARCYHDSRPPNMRGWEEALHAVPLKSAKIQSRAFSPTPGQRPRGSKDKDPHSASPCSTKGCRLLCTRECQASGSNCDSQGAAMSSRRCISGTAQQTRSKQLPSTSSCLPKPRVDVATSDTAACDKNKMQQPSDRTTTCNPRSSRPA